MSEFLQWVQNNPSAAISLLSAVIAASVALLVFGLTQYFTQKREQTRFLTPKLEELYLLLNTMAEENVSFFKLYYSCAEGNDEACSKLREIDELDLYGHKRTKKIIMYIRLYFPKLSKIHQHLFKAQGNLNKKIWSLYTETPATSLDIINASGKVVHFMRLMEQEIIQNRDVLLEDYAFLKRYRESSKEELESILPLPDGLVMSSPNKANSDDPKSYAPPSSALRF
ncbi:hypothetical protein [Candidatus Thiosymbion oneisti]|uniref:hypothetical protein n=1 Tax=Candidatus Thiosymbion oneisti TaxID=589554 RepID=UPI000B7F7416|nr:hypothetical protein [Candidatus Thiosymbion oneisti]